MNENIYPFLTISGFFLFFLLVRKISKFNFCLFCASVFLTWLIFLILFYLDKFNNLILISILMGGSIVGIIYLLEEKLKEKFLFFKLPFYLTLVFIALIFLKFNFYFEIFNFILIIWLIFLLLFLFKNNKKIKEIFQVIINCCKNW